MQELLNLLSFSLSFTSSSSSSTQLANFRLTSTHSEHSHSPAAVPSLQGISSTVWGLKIARHLQSKCQLDIEFLHPIFPHHPLLIQRPLLLDTPSKIYLLLRSTASRLPTLEVTGAISTLQVFLTSCHNAKPSKSETSRQTCQRRDI